MKNRCTVFLILIGLVFVSCNKDDDNTESENQQSNSKLIGKWGQVSFVQGEDLMVVTDCEKRSTIEFTQNSYKEIGYAPVNTDCRSISRFQEPGKKKELH